MASTKLQELEFKGRKSEINLSRFFTIITQFLQERPYLLTFNLDISTLRNLIVQELTEVAVYHDRGQDGSENQILEIIDVFVFATSLVINYIRNTRNIPDLDRVLHNANGQGKHSNVFDRLREVGGNIDSKVRLEQDLDEFLTVLTSLLLNNLGNHNFEAMVDIVVKKITQNLAKDLLSGHPVMQQVYGRDLSQEEITPYVIHYLKSMRLLRNSVIARDPAVEHTGLPDEFLRNVHLLVLMFDSMPGFWHISPEVALRFLILELENPGSIDLNWR